MCVQQGFGSNAMCQWKGGNIVYDGENFYLAQGTTGKIAQRYYAVAALCGDDLEEYRKEFNQAWESDESASDEDEKNL